MSKVRTVSGGSNNLSIYFGPTLIKKGYSTAIGGGTQAPDPGDEPEISAGPGEAAVCYAAGDAYRLSRWVIGPTLDVLDWLAENEHDRLYEAVRDQYLVANKCDSPVELLAAALNLNRDHLMEALTVARVTVVRKA